MARLGRYFLADQPLHVIQRGGPRESGDRQAIFFHDGDYASYRRRLAEPARHHGCAVHAYVLMTNQKSFGDSFGDSALNSRIAALGRGDDTDVEDEDLDAYLDDLAAPGRRRRDRSRATRPHRAANAYRSRSGIK